MPALPRLPACSSTPHSRRHTPRSAEPGTGTISFTYGNQNAKKFWQPVDGAITRVKGPLGATDANLAQNTMRFAANYAVNDFVALDVGELRKCVKVDRFSTTTCRES